MWGDWLRGECAGWPTGKFNGAECLWSTVIGVDCDFIEERMNVNGSIFVTKVCPQLQLEYISSKYVFKFSDNA